MGDTTQPSERTGRGASEHDVLLLRWVYPSPLNAPLINGVVFGRDASAGVPLPGNEASRRHAEVTRVGPVPTLRDLGSRNGTWVNGRRITETPIGPRDV